MCLTARLQVCCKAEFVLPKTAVFGGSFGVRLGFVLHIFKLPILYFQQVDGFVSSKNISLDVLSEVAQTVVLRSAVFRAVMLKAADPKAGSALPAPAK